MYYFVTISPTYKLIDPEHLHKAYTIDITRQMNKFSRRWALYPEFDDKQRLHYHGLAYVHDTIKMYKVKHLLDKIGWTKLQKCIDFEDRLSYLIYSQKQYAEIQSHYPIISYKPMRKLKLLSQQTKDNLSKPAKFNIIEFLNSFKNGIINPI